MIDRTRVAQLLLFPETLLPPKTRTKPPSLHTYWLHARDLPASVSESLTIRRYLELFGPLDWDGVPERNLQRNGGQVSIPYTALIAAELIKLNESLPSTHKLKRFLVEHPGFISLLGFPLVPAPNHPLGFNALASLPTQRHLNRLFRQLPNASLQFLLADSVRLILVELATQDVLPIECISLDTKHVIAWAKENNPKAYVKDRYDKTKQPKVSAASAATISPAPNPRRPAIPSRRPARKSVNTIGGMGPGSSSPKFRTGASSCWPN